MLPPQGAVVRISPITVGGVKALLKEGFVSAVGHESTAQALTLLTGIEVPVNRTAIRLAPGDQLIVFQLAVRLPEGAVLTKEEVQALYQEGKASFYLVEVVG